MEKCLEGGGTLLEQMKQMEQSQSQSVGESSELAETVQKSDDFAIESTLFQADSLIVDQKSSQDYNSAININYLSKNVDNPLSALEDGSNKAVQNVNLSNNIVNAPEGLCRPSSAEDRSSIGTPAGTELPAGTSALASQLELLDRAAAALPGHNPYSGQDVPPAPSMAAGRETSLLAAPAQSDITNSLSASSFAPGGELEWAEQADRAFRRDNRRYDGGFYLY